MSQQRALDVVGVAAGGDEAVAGAVPILGDLFAGLFWPLWLTFGVIMAVALVGLVGWPLMAATISSHSLEVDWAKTWAVPP